MSKGKGKEPAHINVPVMLNPATGSANPAASMSALWAYLQPALDHIVKSASNDPNGKAPAIDVGFYSGIHSACYNYFTAQSEAANSNARLPDSSISNGPDIYEQLDKYFADATCELLLGAPHDDTTLIHYIVPCFNRYTAGAQSVNRLLSYVNRHYVKRAVDEDKGWLRLNDVLEFVAKTITVTDTREKISRRLRERRLDELKKWGYEEGDSSELLAIAEACAEAASPPDRVVPVISLAYRRFRTEFFEPLLAVPVMKGKSKAKHKIPKTPNGSAAPGPKGRLARAVKELLESKDINEEERIRLTTELSKALKTVGIRPDHPLRKRLDKYVASCAKGG
ncbi:Cullin repeat-like-containing domain protein [Lyophyllum atratum]|nr:Cullin repeat-like-containing domain protein [Lyophyllum atratum]